MATFDRFQLQNEYITLENSFCCSNCSYTIKKSSIISVEKTKIYSIIWSVVGLALVLSVLVDPTTYVYLSILGAFILTYQLILVFSMFTVIRVPGYIYKMRYCGEVNFDQINQWFLSQQNIQMDTQPMLVSN